MMTVKCVPYFMCQNRTATGRKGIGGALFRDSTQNFQSRLLDKIIPYWPVVVAGVGATMPIRGQDHEKPNDKEKKEPGLHRYRRT
jgi:hypothetical protein